MFKRNAMGSTRTKFVAGAVLLAIGLSAGSAMATNVYGGGATLPAGAYVGFGFLPSAKLSSNVAGGAGNISSTSLFGAGAGTGNATSYCQTGSGGGKKIFDHFDGVSGNVYSGTASCTGSATPNSTTGGFGAATTAAIDPHFVGSDAPFSQSEFDWYRSGNKAATGGQPVQFPAVIGSIAIAFNKPGVSSLNLTEAQVCGIFNHTITDWSQLVSGQSGAINVVYRADGSGTTFSLANHLSAVCSGSASAHFVTDQSFANVVSLFGAIPSNWSGQSGNPAVVNAVNNTVGSIGYAESANLKAAPAANVSVASVNGFDPYEGLPDTIALPMTSERVVVSPNATTGRPVTAAVTASGGYVPVSQCLNIVEPTLYATSTSRYPIIAVSYLIANNKGNGADTSAVQALIGSAYNTAIRSGVTTIGNPSGAANGTGYAYITPTPASGQPSAAARVSSCITM